MNFILKVLTVLVCTGLPLISETKEVLPSVDSFQIDSKLKIEKFAESPMIYSPVAMDVDPQGRVWVTEDIHLTGEKDRGRITVLEDTDGDGKADKAHEFGPRFRSIPMGIAIFDNVIVVSMAPDLIVYTDVNRDAKFDEKVDTRKVLINGFHGSSHDHSLHAVVGAPNGQWYFNHGNIGADIKLSDGKEYHFSSYYSQNRNSLGLKSSDGKLYVGGFGMSMNPDGTNSEVIYQNTRNTHDMFVTSFGDVLHSDNDDPAHARATWAMKYSNFGYASLENGSRSWEEAAKSWEEKEFKSYGRRLNQAHWRENYPGTTPPGSMWGAGAPTGNLFIEGDELGKELRGTYIICETVNQALFSFKPQLSGAHWDMGSNEHFVSLKKESKNGFLPTDIITGLDGSLYFSDWNSFNNRRGKGNKEGAIYRISHKSEKTHKIPSADLKSKEGLLEALKSPAVNIRWVAVDKLKKMEGVYESLNDLYSKSENPYIKARVIWIMPQLKDGKGLEFTESLLEDKNELLRLTALRSLLYANPTKKLIYLNRMVKDSSRAVKLEVALNLRNVELDKSADALTEIITNFEGNDRWYLEAIGTAVEGKEEEVYKTVIQKQLPKDYSKWTAVHKDLAWRVRSKSALTDLTEVIKVQKPEINEFRKLIMTFSLVYNDAEQKENLARVKDLQSNPAFKGDDYQLTISEVLDKDIIDKRAIILDASYRFPEKYGNETKLSSAKEIAALTGNVENGKTKAAICTTCHKIGEYGLPFGPNLTNWAQTRNVETVVHNIINPSAELAHGFDKAVVVANKKFRVEGIELGYSYHAGAVKVKTVGGQILKIAFRKSGTKIEYLKNHSWMPSAAKLGLNDQDVRDIVEYLKSL